MNKSLLLCLLVLLLASCKKETVPVTATASSETVGNVVVNNLDFAYLSAKGQFTMNDQNDNLSSGVSLRMKKDSVIWLSVLPGLGIEAARMKLTQDSVFLLNRLRKEYLATDYAFFRHKLNLEIDFEAVQAILLGNYQPKGKEKVLREQGIQHVQQLREHLVFDYFIAAHNNKLERLQVLDEQTGNTISVSYAAFQVIGQVPFAHAMKAQVLQQGQVADFSLNHNRVAVTDEKLDFPFSIPADYKPLPLN